MTTEHFGILFSSSVERDEDGYIEIPVIIEESGLMFAAPPPELRIRTAGSPSREEFLRRYTAKLNRNTDLPFYLAQAKVKIVGDLEMVTDEILEAEGLEPLSED